MRSLVLGLSTALLAAALSVSAAAGAAPPAVSAARHHGTISGTSIRWRSELVLRPDGARTIELAYPLPEGTVIEISTDATPVRREQRVVAFEVLPEAEFRGKVVVTLSEPFDRRARDTHLRPPVAAGDAVQIVDITGADDLRFEPAPQTRLARHVGFFAPVDLPPSARHACDRAVGYFRARPTDDPMYLVPSAPLAAEQGIRGTLVSTADRLRTGAIGAGGVFVALVVGLVLMLRKLARAAKIEQAERALAAEYASLESEGERP